MVRALRTRLSYWRRVWGCCSSLKAAAFRVVAPTQTRRQQPTRARSTEESRIMILARLTAHPHDDIRKAMRHDGMLQTSGLIRINSDSETDLENKIKLVRDLQDIMLENLSDDELSRRVLCPSQPGKLSLDDFSHLAKDIQLLQNYLTGAIRQNEKGANILLYGRPDTGKTEFAKALAACLTSVAPIKTATPLPVNNAC